MKYLVLRNTEGTPQTYIMDEGQAAAKKKRGEAFEILSEHDKIQDATKALEELNAPKAKRKPKATTPEPTPEPETKELKSL